MTDEQIQEIADRVIESLNNLAPSEPEWWEILIAFAPFSALVAAFLITGVAWRTLRQKREADDHSEWWKRTQWALDATTSENPKMVAYGREMVKLLLESKMASTADKEVLDAVWAKSETHMDDADIHQLVRDFVAAGLTEEEQSSIEGLVDDSPGPGDDGPTKEEP